MPQNKITFEELCSLCPEIEYEWFSVFPERPVSDNVKSELRHMLNDRPWLFEMCVFQSQAAALLIHLEWSGDGPHPARIDQIEIAAGRLISQMMLNIEDASMSYVAKTYSMGISTADLLSISEFTEASKSQVLIYLSDNPDQVTLMVNLAQRARVARAGGVEQLAMGGFIDE